MYYIIVFTYEVQYMASFAICGFFAVVNKQYCRFVSYAAFDLRLCYGLLLKLKNTIVSIHKSFLHELAQE